MIILDTNVISEMMRESPDPKVLRWIAEQNPSDLAITAIAVAEIMRGIARLPTGRRQDTLLKNFTAFIRQAFSGRILPFEESSAFLYGSIAAQREKAGFNTDAVDLMIVAIAASHHAAIATRNTRDFENCGIKIINPWQEKAMQ